MSKTKGELAVEALEDIGFDQPIDSSTIKKTITNLERMVAGWVNKNIFVSYNFSDSPLAGQDSGISRFDEEAIVSNLSVRMASVLDVVITNHLMNIAKNSYNKLMLTSPPEYTGNPYQPLGAGKNRCYEYFFDYAFQSEDDLIEVITGDSRNARVDFSSFAPVDQIQSITWNAQTATIEVSNIQTIGNTSEALLTFSKPGTYCVLVKATNTSGVTETASLRYEVKSCSADVDNDRQR